ncbi:MAG: hypothetical protein ACJ788_25640 [Ktedonobacteraceae bacterium]
MTQRIHPIRKTARSIQNGQGHDLSADSPLLPRGHQHSVQGDAMSIAIPAAALLIVIGQLHMLRHKVQLGATHHKLVASERSPRFEQSCRTVFGVGGDYYDAFEIGETSVLGGFKSRNTSCGVGAS